MPSAVRWLCAALERQGEYGVIRNGNRRRGRFIAGLLFVLCVATSFGGIAQDRNVLVRALRSGSDFRTRVQAAFALGNTGDRAMRSHLERALRESDPAVRAAAATALGRLGDPRARRALRRARRDSSAAVRMQAQRSLELLESGARAAPAADPTAARRVRTGDGVYASAITIPRAREVHWPRVRYVVVMGEMANQSDFRDATPLLGDLREQVRRGLRLLRGVAFFESSEALSAEARREVRRRRLPLLRLDGNLMEVNRRRQGRELSVRCSVNLVLVTEPGRDLRGMLTGAATGSEPTQRNRNAQVQRLAQQALTAAVRSAMSSAPSALRAAAQR